MQAGVGHPVPAPGAGHEAAVGVDAGVEGHLQRVPGPQRHAVERQEVAQELGVRRRQRRAVERDASPHFHALEHEGPELVRGLEGEVSGVRPVVAVPGRALVQPVQLVVGVADLPGAVEVRDEVPRHLGRDGQAAGLAGGAVRDPPE